MTALRRLRRIAAFAAVAAAAVLSASCTGGGNGTVSGRITLNGQPLKDGLITFESQVGSMNAYSAAIRDGIYETEPIPAGLCKVTVIHSAVPRPTETGGNDLVPVRTPKQGPGQVVPDKYHKSDTSGLTFTVKAGANTYDQDLTP